MIVPAVQVVDVSRLLAVHSIPHAIDGEVPSHHHAEAPSELVIRVGLAVEVADVQEILDMVP